MSRMKSRRSSGDGSGPLTRQRLGVAARPAVHLAPRRDPASAAREILAHPGRLGPLSPGNPAHGAGEAALQDDPVAMVVTRRSSRSPPARRGAAASRVPLRRCGCGAGAEVLARSRCPGRTAARSVRPRRRSRAPGARGARRRRRAARPAARRCSARRSGARPRPVLPRRGQPIGVEHVADDRLPAELGQPPGLPGRSRHRGDLVPLLDEQGHEPDADDAGGPGEDDPQLNACFRSARIFVSLSRVRSLSANATGHMAPSSRFEVSWKPSIAYRSLNFPASRK